MLDTPSKLTETEHSKPFIILSTKTHTHTLILLHGLSTDGVAFGTEFIKTGLNSTRCTLPQAFPHVKYVFPSGAPRRCTAFDGKMMHVCFDITTITDRTIGEENQVEGVAETTTYLCKSIRDEMAILELFRQGKEDLALCGSSQGCAMGIWEFLNIGSKLGGFV